MKKINTTNKNCKTIGLILLPVIVFAVSFFCPYSTVSANSSTVNINQKYQVDSEIYSSVDGVSTNAITVSGKVELNNESSIVRLIATDVEGLSYLVYEASELVAETKKINLNDECEETCSLDDVMIKSLRVEVVDGEFDISSFSMSDLPLPAFQGLNKNQIKKDKNDVKIKEIRKKIKDRNQSWVAGETSFSSLFYAEKQKLFKNGKVPNLQGAEFYLGGVFELVADNSTITSFQPQSKSAGSAAPVSQIAYATSEDNAIGVGTAPLVDGFDWRNRHGVSWLTPVRNQASCGSCWAFSSTGATESAINLFFNQHLDIDLSEQDVNSCSGAGNCVNGGVPEFALDFFKNTGVVNEGCFPYTATDSSCSLKCANPTELIKITGRIDDYTRDADTMKRMIAQYGPVSLTLSPWWHAMVLVGWKKIQQGDNLWNGDTYSGSPSAIYVDAGSPLIGKTYWIFKNSWGPGWGVGGYMYITMDMASVGGVSAIQTPVISTKVARTISCTDADSDGYCFWGTGTKPPSCDALSCKPYADCDDSNATLLRYKLDNSFVCATAADLNVKKINSFNFESFAQHVIGTIDENNHSINLMVPLGTDITSLAPTITIEENASISPSSGIAQNFTNPVIYTVTAENGTTQDYSVTVTPTVPDHIEISPSITQTITAGQSITFSAQGKDQNGNNISGFAYVWSGTDSGGVFNETIAGSYYVKASFGETESATITVNVLPAALNQVSITSDDEDLSISAGEAVQFIAHGKDRYGNEISGLTFHWYRDWTPIESGLFSETFAAVYEISAYSEDYGFYSSVFLTVNPSTVVSRADIYPEEDLTLSAGEEINFFAVTADPYDNQVFGTNCSWEGTDSEGFFMETLVGTYPVRVFCGGTESPTINVTIIPAALDHIDISPTATQTVVAGQTIQFVPQPKDRYGNNISDATYAWAGTNSLGIFSNNTVGTYSVKASTGGKDSPTITVNVVPAAIDHIDISPTATQTILTTQNIQFSAIIYDQYNNRINDETLVWTGTNLNGLFSKSKAGSYVVKATSGGIDSKLVFVTVHAVTPPYVPPAPPPTPPTYIASVSSSSSHSSSKKKKKAKKKKSSKYSISNSKSKFKIGQVLVQKGKKFTPNGLVRIYSARPGGIVYSARTIRANASGGFSASLVVGRTKGSYSWYAVDAITGKKSKTIKFKVK